MKVLFLHSQCENGGISRIVFSICELLKQCGSEGRFAFSRGFIPEEHANDCFMFGDKKEIAKHVMLSRLFDKHGCGSKKATEDLIEWIDSYEPDIIHINNVHGYYLNMDIFFNYLKRKKTPVVWTLHDCWAITGHCSHFEYAKCDKWKTKCGNCHYVSTYPRSFLFDNSRNNFKEKQRMYKEMNNITIVTPSEWLKELISQSILADKDCVVINNGIDLENFDYITSNLREENGFDNKRVYLAVASVWTSKKGYDDLIKLVHKIDKSKEQIVAVGVSGAQKRELIKHGIFAVMHTKSVKELASWYSMADVFINPTYEDTFPTVNIEALACGTPVITYKTGGSPEIVNDECGAVVEKGDIDSLYNEATQINSSRETCRKRALRYDKNERFLEYINLYQTIMKRESEK